MRLRLFILIATTFLVCCGAIVIAQDTDQPVNSGQASVIGDENAHPNLRKGIDTVDRNHAVKEASSNTVLAADDEDEERSVFTKLKGLFQSNKGVTKISSMGAKNDLGKLKSTVGTKPIKLTTRDVQKLQSFAKKNPDKGLEIAEILMRLMVSGLVIGMGVTGLVLLINELKRGGELE